MKGEFDPAMLVAAGLNLHAVFDLATLPESVRAPLTGCDQRYRQLILVGHGGRRLWDAVQAAGIASDDPIDDFTVRTVQQWAAGQLAGCAWEIVYPDTTGQQLPIGLQTLGKLAGWHHDSPLMVGINDRWGSWFAYRAVILAGSDFLPTSRLPTASPCTSCRHPACASACPAGAIVGSRYDLSRCLAYRTTIDAACAATCLARLACPAAAPHRYDEAQMRHVYSRSLRWIIENNPGAR